MSLHTYITCIVCNFDALKVIQKCREYPDYFIPILEPLGHMQSIPRTLYLCILENKAFKNNLGYRD